MLWDYRNDLIWPQLACKPASKLQRCWRSFQVSLLLKSLAQVELRDDLITSCGYLRFALAFLTSCSFLHVGFWTSCTLNFLRINCNFTSFRHLWVLAPLLARALFLGCTVRGNLLSQPIQLDHWFFNFFENLARIRKLKKEGFFHGSATYGQLLPTWTEFLVPSFPKGIPHLVCDNRNSTFFCKSCMIQLSGDPVLSNPLIEITKRAVSMGKPENFPSYGWDNEYGEWNVKWVNWVWKMVHDQ